MRIYVASSWRNELQPSVVEALRGKGHEVYDFRQPTPGNFGFHWSQIDPSWKKWTGEQFRNALAHPLAISGFRFDFAAMMGADIGVLVMPCGRSAHLEAGYIAGSGKPLLILLSDGEPELMYSMASAICTRIEELLDAVRKVVLS